MTDYPEDYKNAVSVWASDALDFDNPYDFAACNCLLFSSKEEAYRIWNMAHINAALDFENKKTEPAHKRSASAAAPASARKQSAVSAAHQKPAEAAAQTLKSRKAERDKKKESDAAVNRFILGFGVVDVFLIIWVFVLPEIRLPGVIGMLWPCIWLFGGVIVMALLVRWAYHYAFD